ncbi:MAG: hypothetical protein RLZZ184_56 [Cyanobacteriota bacterium]
MTDLFNLCELKFQFHWKRLGTIKFIKLPTFKIEIIQGSTFEYGKLEFTWDISHVDISVPVLYSEYIKNTQELHDYYWAAYENSGDPDDFPF